MGRKKIIEYNLQGQLLFRLGKANFNEAQQPLCNHSHGEMTEFVFMIKGCQDYRVNDEVYTVHGGEVFQAFPGEYHSTGERPEDKASFYYLIVDLAYFGESGYGCMPWDTEALLDAFSSKANRIRNGGEWYYVQCARLMKLCEEKEAFCDTGIRNAVSELLMQLLIGEKAGEGAGSEEERMQSAEAYIRIHLKEEIELDRLARIAGLSESRFKARFLKRMGIPPGEYILREKLAACCLELENGHKSITEIAYEYGFSSSQYFANVFKKYYYRTPSQLRAGK